MKEIYFLLLFFSVGIAASQNLHVQANAASITNEANATTGWTGAGNIVSSTTNPFSGNFALSVSRTAANGRDMGYTFNAVVGTAYTISIYARAGASSFQPAFANWVGFTGFSTTVINGTNWVQYNWNVTATSTSPIIRVYATPISGGQTGNEVLIDNVSIVAVSSGGGTDTTAPSVPTGLSASNITATSLMLNWNAATDNVGVTDYEVFQGNTSLGLTAGTRSSSVAGLSAETTYSFRVRAFDAAGNMSGLSSTLSVTTASQGGGTATAYTDQNANLSSVDWRARDLFAFRNLGIGTTNTQGYRLAVAGNIIAEEIKVELQSTWPDYVFSGSHPLLSLEDLEYYINTNGHLPNVPSAYDIKIKGINLGAMQAILLEKIEELTLYILQQHKEIKKQAEQLEELKSVILEQNIRIHKIEIAIED